MAQGQAFILIDDIKVSLGDVYRFGDVDESYMAISFIEDSGTPETLKHVLFVSVTGKFCKMIHAGSWFRSNRWRFIRAATRSEYSWLRNTYKINEVITHRLALKIVYT